MQYDWGWRVVVMVPLGMEKLGNKIAQSFDYDDAGDKNFEFMYAGEVPEVPIYHVMDMVARGDKLPLFNTAKDSKAQLKDAVDADYEGRFKVKQKPSTKECTDFADAAIIIIEKRGRTLQEVLADRNLLLMWGPFDTPSVPDLPDVKPQ